MPIKKSTKEQLLVEIEQLQHLLETLRSEKANLEIMLETTTEHADAIESQLLTAREIAEEASRAKSQFLANMSHEIRTPLNGIIGMTNLLSDTPLTYVQRDYVDTIRTSGEVLLALVNDILDFSKIEAGKLDLESQPIDLRQCIEESLDLLAPAAAQKQINLAYLIANDTPEIVVSDVTRLRQILGNLLSNAVKFTPHGGEVVVSVSAYPLSAEENSPSEKSTDYTEYELHFAVKDTGIGIPPERVNTIFQSFSQVDASITRKYGGTGLGLVISQRLSQMMGGQIWVESEVGTGSTFHVTIVTQASYSEHYAHLTRKHPHLLNKRLLISSSNKTNCMLLKQQTKRWGMKSQIATTLLEVFGALRQNPQWDVIIVEMSSPENKDLILLEKMTKFQKKRLPLILLVPIYHIQQNQPNIVACLSKPIKPIKLYEVLIELFTPPAHTTPLPPTATTHSLPKTILNSNPLKILLAEDNLVNQKVALLLLKKLGHEVVDVVSNGLEVLTALQRHSYDIIFMDIQMPEMDGLTATRQIIKEWSGKPRPWIIAMTANAMQGDREICLAAGMDDYLSKPIREEELAQALLQCYSHKDISSS
ncbi:signal transduction histidine kinase [Thioploca ingrica]|uniref:histidine kinase n=1 Tax=Thioploca ingrica TaxID=40754 RepID=A0A090BUL5_9GAMM|nr:signal transduction histidine kinase [Thioploca ingrica]